MQETIKSDSEIIIAQNQEEWNRLLFLLQAPDPNVLWINCDTAQLKKPLHDALTASLPKLKPYDIYISEKTESLNRIILWEDNDKIPANAIIHIFGLEDAVKSVDFLGNLNFQRDSLFRKAPAHIIFWSDFATGTILTHKAYDFWSWIVFTFDFKMPVEFLTSRQKRYGSQLILEDTTIQTPQKDSQARIRHLEHEWEEFLRSINGKILTKKQIKDAITITIALAKEYRDEGKYNDAINVLDIVQKLAPDILSENDKGLIWNEMALAYSKIERHEIAKDLYEKALNIAFEIYGENSINAATVLSNLGVTYTELGDFENAKKILEKGINIYNEISYESHPNKIRDEVNLANVYLHLKDYDKAKILLEKALKDDIKIYGEDSINVSTIYSNLSVAYMNSNNLEKAKDLLQKALSIDIENFGPDNYKLAAKHNNLACLFFQLGDSKGAKLHMNEVYRLLIQTLDENNPKVRYAISFLKNLEENEPRQTT